MGTGILRENHLGMRWELMVLRLTNLVIMNNRIRVSIEMPDRILYSLLEN